MADDGYMNEKHMGVVERSLLSLSGERRKLRDAAAELDADGAEAHLGEALRRADAELERVYKKLFQGTYFHVSEEQMQNAGSSRSDGAGVKSEAKQETSLDVPEPAEEMRLFKAEEASDQVKP